MLLNRDATRTRVEAAVKERIAKSGSGDTLLLTFAGHGSAYRNPATGKWNKSFLLVDHADKGRESERFTDGDLKAWSRELEGNGALLVAVLDACHSGVGIRKLPPKGQPLTPARFVAPPPDETGPAGAPDAIVLKNAYVFGATDTALRVHEAMVDGESRGALSFAFARAIEGGADRFGAGLLTAREVRAFVSQVVRNVSQNSQTPQFHLPDPERVILRPPLPPSRARMLQKPVTLAVIGGGTSPVNASRVKILPQGIADLIWDPGAGQLRNVLGDAVANDLGASDLSTAVDAYWVYRQLAKLAIDGRPLVTKLSPEGTVLCNGSRISLTIGETAFQNVIVFDLSGNGLVQNNYIGRYGAEGHRTPDGWQMQFRIDQPFGADYMAVIATDEPLSLLQRTVEEFDERKAPIELYQAVVRSLRGRDYAMSVHERYSADEKQFPELCGVPSILSGARP